MLNPSFPELLLKSGDKSLSMAIDDSACARNENTSNTVMCHEKERNERQKQPVLLPDIRKIIVIYRRQNNHCMNTT